MTRLVLGSALPVLGLGCAAAFLTPNLFGAPSGMPMLVATAENAVFQPAAFEATECGKSLLLAERAAEHAGLSVMALDFLPGPDGVGVVVEEVPSRGLVPEAALLVVVDPAGRVVATGAAAALAATSAAELHPDCDKAGAGSA